MKHRVVMNDQGQYSTWPSERDLPAGWHEVGFQGTKDECLDHVEAIWVDMRPRSVRRSLGQDDAPAPTVLYSSRVLLREIPSLELRPLLEHDRRQVYQWSMDYPTEGTLIAGKEYLRQIDSGLWRPGFGMYQTIRRSDRTVIGDIGFLSAPDAEGRVGVGFGLAPSARGGGYATEALATLSQWALNQPGVAVVLADTSHENVKSHAVMQRAGFRGVRKDKKLHYYEARAGWIAPAWIGSGDASLRDGRP
jgi:uncharacterized protein YbdZ (MbtH family)/RimJ/RimL family protein N-acetyltransferase